MKTPSFDELRTFVCLALLCDTEVCPMASHGTLTRAYSTHPLVMKYADLLGRVTPSREYETSGLVLSVNKTNENYVPTILFSTLC